MADRIGVINKGELILVEDKADADAQARQEAADAASHRTSSTPFPPALAGHRPRRSRATAASSSTPTTPRASAPASPRCCDDLDESRHRASSDLHTTQSSLEDIFVDLVRQRTMNFRAVRAIYRFEMARTGRTLLQSIVSPVISTSLYFVVFGAAIGSRITEIDGVRYGAFIVPGLIMLSLLDAEHRQRLVRHLFPEVHRHHLRAAVGADLLRRDRARLRRRRGHQVDHPGAHHPRDRRLVRAAAASSIPLWMVAFLVLTAVTFSLFGFIIGIWADGFEKLQVIPLLVITPLTFLGGSFYSIERAAAGLADDHACSTRSST